LTLQKNASIKDWIIVNDVVMEVNHQAPISLTAGVEGSISQITTADFPRCVTVFRKQIKTIFEHTN
jgi:hypothetical protein